MSVVTLHDYKLLRHETCGSMFFQVFPAQVEGKADGDNDEGTRQQENFGESVLRRARTCRSDAAEWTFAAARGTP